VKENTIADETTYINLLQPQSASSALQSYEIEYNLIYIEKHSSRSSSSRSSTPSSSTSSRSSSSGGRVLIIDENVLPDELWMHVFSFMGNKDICNASLVCKNWKRLCMDNTVWQELYMLKFEPPKIASPFTWRTKYIRKKKLNHNWKSQVKFS
jgi:hypothetical protein